MFRRFSLRNRLFIVTGVALLPAFGILAFNEISLRHAREAEIHALALRSGQLAALELQRITDGSEGILTAIAHAPVVRSFVAETCNAYLQDLKAGLPQFTALTVLDLDGHLRCSSGATQVTSGFEKRSYFKDALSTGHFILGEYDVGRNSGKAILPLALPVKDEKGVVFGVLAAGLDLDWLGARLRDRDFIRNSALTVADRNGVILAREPFPERFVGTRIPDAFQHLVHGDKPSTFEVMSQDGTERILGYIPARIMGLYVSAGISKDEAFAPIDKATKRGALLAFLGAVLAFLTAWLLGRGLVRGPINRLLTTIRSWRDGDVAVRTGMDREHGEIATVGAAIDQFMDELLANRAARRKIEEHRDLLMGELDHRVKNTFASVLAVARQSFTSSESSRADFAKFSERLAALSNAHKLLISQQWESADVREIIAACVAPYGGEGPSRFAADGPRLELRPQAVLTLSMAVHELCTNAIKYGALSSADGHISMNWRVTPDGTEPIFCFVWAELDGPPITSPDYEGFGSRMIKKLLALEFGGSVDIAYAPSGLVCTVTAPLARVVKTDHAPGPDRTDDAASGVDAAPETETAPGTPPSI